MKSTFESVAVNLYLFADVTILDAVILVVNVAGMNNNEALPDCEPFCILPILRLVNFTIIVFAEIFVIIPYLPSNVLLSVYV